MSGTYENGIISIELIQGEDFELEVSWEDEEGTPVDVAGYTAKMQFRKNAGDPKKYLEATTENGKISVDTVDNVLRLTIPASEINELIINNLVADFFAISPGNKSYKLFTANAAVKKRVTV
jgi:hypothetical protein